MIELLPPRVKNWEEGLQWSVGCSKERWDMCEREEEWVLCYPSTQETQARSHCNWGWPDSSTGKGLCFFQSWLGLGSLLSGKEPAGEGPSPKLLGRS